MRISNIENKSRNFKRGYGLYGRMIDSKLSATLGLKNDDIWGGRKKQRLALWPPLSSGLKPIFS